jgi:hypothetical protein
LHRAQVLQHFARAGRVEVALRRSAGVARIPVRHAAAVAHGGGARDREGAVLLEILARLQVDLVGDLDVERDAPRQGFEVEGGSGERHGADHRRRERAIAMRG